MKWVLIFILMSGNPPYRMVLADEKNDFNFQNEQECRDVQQQLLLDKEFIKLMFAREYILVPTCLEIESIPAPKLKRWPFTQRHRCDIMPS